MVAVSVYILYNEEWKKKGMEKREAGTGGC